MSGIQTISAQLPIEQVGAISEVASATGSTFDEVLSCAVGYAMGDARHVYGVTLAEGGHAD
jgi:hypothetical protein